MSCNMKPLENFYFCWEILVIFYLKRFKLLNPYPIISYWMFNARRSTFIYWGSGVLRLIVSWTLGQWPFVAQPAISYTTWMHAWLIFFGLAHARRAIVRLWSRQIFFFFFFDAGGHLRLLFIHSLSLSWMSSRLSRSNL